MGIGFVFSSVNWVLRCQTLKNNSLDLSCFCREISNQLISICVCLCRVVRETHISKRKKVIFFHRCSSITRPRSVASLSIGIFCLVFYWLLFVLANKTSIPPSYSLLGRVTQVRDLQFEEISRFPMESSATCSSGHHSEEYHPHEALVHE